MEGSTNGERSRDRKIKLREYTNRIREWGKIGNRLRAKN
jgi:hypothetical protein